MHDTSASGATLFVEPPAAVEFGNRMRELESEEFEEVERILRELTDELRPRRDEIIATLEALVELDTLYARARFAIEYACSPATLVPAREGFDDSTMAGTRCCSRRAPTSCRSIWRWSRTSARCSCPGRTPAERRFCSRRSG